ncbi:glycerophosphoryl diester phosphodiesterase [Coxiella burnetii]|uniref:Glycerophosphoryl diester phosphodiesterase n=1 Tax=Coxiella burnetii (strain RSA 493 / Nine Mile phase I) TaxID=227377 RepID=Q83DQ4_COXBU|nr:glycerophosphoryl diester phosphodiesterase [Coxiella burnetii]NP_819672.1 glycerophosphoryl diester phosphodiesterase [Coxiella burnetii RSA 493]AAO90186.1 glycerophosphoryl diester phosphodiesterase [Coxiella burnetii RSA 493]ACJ20765.1 glycerophosphoryl diester phosphodiesterase [Coxiella burnetii CbuK_Q154]ARI65507.1 glycerophosphoryl diester phosphodiesterase [Coxiella burnetii]ARK26988.1 glycerophosphoryl diester phosphodiesterase [Coxiella burnetii]ATN74095.1 glycerophosphoryl diest
MPLHIKMKTTQLNLPKVIAHRGASLSAPENTVAALREAKRLGARWVEFDVRLTRDGQAIIFHDPWLGRTTNGRGMVSKAHYAHIAELDAGNWFNPQFANERVPTFAEYLKEAASLNLGVNIELKATPSHASDLAKQVFQELKEHWPVWLPKPLISSFSLACLRAMREQSDDCLLGYLPNRWRDNWEALLAANQCVSIHLNYKQLTAERIKMIKQTSYYLLAYTVNDSQLATDLLSQGVDAVVSDNPELLK